MKHTIVPIVLALCLAGSAANGQTPMWQQEMDDARRAAAGGRNTGLMVRPGSKMEANWAAGVYVFYNSPRPFCYMYAVPGEWLPGPGEGGMLRAKDGRALANVTFVPPRKLAGIEGATILERGRNSAVRELENSLHQPLVGASLVPFDSARPGTWQLTAAPVSHRDGQKAPLPLYVIVDLSPHTVAEINVMDSGADEDLARRIIAGLRTTNDPGCYFSELESMLKAVYGER